MRNVNAFLLGLFLFFGGGVLLLPPPPLSLMSFEANSSGAANDGVGTPFLEKLFMLM